MGNQQWRFTVDLICALMFVGGFFSVEHAKQSFILDTPEAQYLISLPGIYMVYIDQCMYDLLAPDNDGDINKRIKKPTYILINVLSLSQLSVCCDRNHTHTVCIGSVRVEGRAVRRSKAASAYPSKLCKAWAGQLRRHFVEGRCHADAAMTIPRYEVC